MFETRNFRFTLTTPYSLSAGTTYMIVVDGPSAERVGIATANSDDEDHGSMSGWAIGDDRVTRLTSDEDWTSGSSSLRLQAEGEMAMSTATPTATATNTPEPTNTPVATGTPAPTNTPVPGTPTATATVTPTITLTATPSPTPTVTPTITPTVTPSPTPTATARSLSGVSRWWATATSPNPPARCPTT